MRKLWNTLIFYLAVVLGTIAAAQVPAPQLNLTGNIGCQGFPCLNSGTLVFASDANHTMTAQESSATGGIKITSGVSLTATRSLVIPSTFGKLQFVTIENASSGGQTINVCAGTGTVCGGGAPLPIPNGQSAAGVWFDGTNVIGTLTGGGGSGTVSGQANQTVPLATGTTAIGAQSHITEPGDGKTHITQPAQFDGSGPPISIPANKATSPAAGTAQLGTDSSGNLVVSENNGAQARICDSTNGVCAGSALTANVLNTDVGTSNFIGVGPSEGLVINGGYPEKLATLLGIPSGNWNINAIGSGSEPDWFSCSNSICNNAGLVIQNGAWPLTFPLGVTNLTKTLLFGGFNSVSAWSGSPTAAQLDYFRGHWLAWSILYGTPDAQKIAANNTTYCSTTGTWTAAGAGFPSGSLSNTSGSGSITCTFLYAKDAGMIFVKKVSDTATFTMTVNGSSVLDPSTSSTTIPASAPYTGSLGGTSDLYALTTGNTLAGGMTTIVLTVTASSGGNAVIVVAPVALSPLNNITNSPPVVIGLAPYQCNNGVPAGNCSAASNHTDAQINQARTQQINVANELRGLLNVGIFDMNAPNGMNANIVQDVGAVKQYTVTAGGSGFGTPVVTFFGGACTIQPTATGANLPTVSGGSLVTATYYVTTSGQCTSAPTVTITGGSGATATAAFDFDFVHPNEFSGALVAKLAQNAYNSAATVADKYTYAPASSGGSPGGSSGQIQYNNSGSFAGSAATITSGGAIAAPLVMNIADTTTTGNAPLYIGKASATGASALIYSSLGPNPPVANGGANFGYANMTGSVSSSNYGFTNIGGSGNGILFCNNSSLNTNAPLFGGCTSTNAGDVVTPLSAGLYSGTANLGGGSSTIPTIIASNPATGNIGVIVSESYAPSVSAQSLVLHAAGVSTAANNSVLFGFKYQGGSGSSQNWGFLGLLGSSGAFGVCSNGSIATALPYGGSATCPSTNAGDVTIPSGAAFNMNSDTGLSRDSAGVVDVGNGTAGDASGAIKAANVTDSALTSGHCVQAGTGGLLTTIAQPCNLVRSQDYYWNIQGVLFATSTMLGPTHLAPYTPSSFDTVMTARLSGTISCSVAPVIQLMDLGTSPTTVYGSATSVASLTTGTSDGVYSVTWATGSSIISGHYYGIGFSAGTCATAPTFDISATW